MSKPSTNEKSTAFDGNSFKQRIEMLTTQLLTKAQEAHELYFLANLNSIWVLEPLAKRDQMFTSDFNPKTNQLIELLHSKKPKLGEKIRPHEWLFLLLLLLEAKGFYATLRNFTHIVRGMRPRAEPWSSDEWNGRPDARFLSTTIIIRNLKNELAEAGFDQLANEFAKVHQGQIQKIRNAIAHGTFYPPTDDSKDQWLFASYLQSGDVGNVLEHFGISSAAFGQLIDQLMFFHLGVYRAIHELKATYKEETFFSATEAGQKKGVYGLKFMGGMDTFFLFGKAGNTSVWKDFTWDDFKNR